MIIFPGCVQKWGWRKGRGYAVLRYFLVRFCGNFYLVSVLLRFHKTRQCTVFTNLRNFDAVLRYFSVFVCGFAVFRPHLRPPPPRPRRIARNWMRTDFNKRDRVSAQLSLWSSPSLVVKPHLLPSSETCAIGCALSSIIVAECLLNCVFYLHHHLW